MSNDRPRERFELAAELAARDRQRRVDIEADQIFEHPRRLILRSENGHYWQLTVDNAGALHTTDLGSAVP